MRWSDNFGYDFKKISFEKIKDGGFSLSGSNDNSKLVSIPVAKLRKNNRLRREKAQKAKIFWDKFYDEVFFGSIATGTILMNEKFNNINKLSVRDYDDGWRVEQDKNGNLIYCNKIKSGWSAFNFGNENWSDYSVSFRMKFTAASSGKVEAHVRKSNNSDHRAYIKQLGRQTSIELLGEQQTANASATEWLEVEISLSGSEIKTFINGEMTTASNNAYLKKGSAMIAVSKNSKLCVDDIIVKKL